LSSNIPASKKVITTLSTANGGALQTGADGKIYLARAEKNYLGIIENPDEANPTYSEGASGMQLGGGMYSLEGLPTFVASFFGTSFTASGFCLDAPTQFTISNTDNIQSVQWYFDYPNLSPTSTDLAPSYQFSVGEFTIRLEITYTNGKTSASSQTIEIFPMPVVDLGTDRELCHGDTLHVELTGLDYVWNTPSGTVLQENFPITEPGTYSLSVTDRNGCTADDEVVVTVNPLPEITFDNLTNSMDHPTVLLILQPQEELRHTLHTFGTADKARRI